MTGATQVYSRVYRVGRIDDGREVRARIRIDDRPHDITIDEAAIDDAFDAAKAGAIVPVDIVCEWTRDSANALVLDAVRSKIMRVWSNWKPISGSDFLDAIHAALPDAFADLDETQRDAVQPMSTTEPREDKQSDTRARAAAEWIAIDDLVPWDKNPRRHAPEKVKEASKSLRRFGFVNPVVTWGGRLVGGHMRRRAMLAILRDDPKLEKSRNAKLRATLTGPTVRHLPVRCGQFDSEAEANAYAIRDNNPLGEWNDESLGDVLRELPDELVDIVGFSEKELQRLVPEIGDDDSAAGLGLGEQKKRCSRSGNARRAASCGTKT